MLKSEKIGLVKYEFIVYINVLNDALTYKVNGILLTKDDLENTLSKNNDINWVRVEGIDVVDTEEIGEDSVEETKMRICGLFDTEPLDWKYAQIIVNDYANTKQSYAIAKMPRSPIIPVYFDVKE